MGGEAAVVGGSGELLVGIIRRNHPDLDVVVAAAGGEAAGDGVEVEGEIGRAHV